MEWNKQNLKGALLVLCGGAAFYAALQHLKAVALAVGWLTGILAPFLLGGAIAFVLNVPMRAIERHLYPRAKRGAALRRPLALVLTLLALVGVLVLASCVIGPGVKDAVKTVTCAENIIYPAEGETKYRIALFDYGVKYNIERELCKRGCEVTVVPAYTKPEDVVGKYDGVMLSNGPGDPAENVEIVANLKELLKSDMPIFGICLGHQLLALAIDAKTTKLKYGHRGVNHPVKDIDADRTYITSQNHGYAVVGESVDPQIARVRYVNLNDGTVEGLEHIGRPVFTVQYHPEVCPGPMDTSYLFDKFIENIEKSKGGAQ